MRKTERLPRIVDVAIPALYEGIHIPITSILDKEVVVTAFHYIPSQFENRLNRLTVAIEIDGKKAWFTTFSLYIIEFFERVPQESLPCRATFVKGKDEAGNYVYTVR